MHSSEILLHCGMFGDIHSNAEWRSNLSGNERTTLDLKGLQCPLPVLRTNKALRQMSQGDELRVLATDPAAVQDFESFCRMTGHTLVASEDVDGVYCFVIRKGG
jgi:tRNA 2-thiouridine synthesizing protein A